MTIDRRALRDIVLYGIFGGVLIALLKLIEYRYLVIEYSASIYGGLVAVIFSAVCIWLCRMLRKTKKVESVVIQEVQVPLSAPFELDTANLARLGITPREHEILTLIAAGLSTREIASRLFVSENTVKTHSSRLFDKLGARRRTQAVQIAKDQRLLP
jgi:DNA-binding CsgD family transcriptional regulator